MFRTVLALASMCSLAACGDVLMPVDGDLDADASRVAESSAAAFGILALVNDPTTTFELLDVAVGLDARAARSIVWHRNGPDGLHGTGDDDALDSVEEVDAQYYVGRTALERLEAYADLHGYTPKAHDFVGVWDGVAFTLEELQLTLDLANTASETELDDTYGLDRRAASGIVEGRPFHTMDGLADAYYVGGSALETLRDEAAAAAGGGEGDDCSTSADCASGMVCMGELAYNNGIFCVDEEDAAGTFTQTPGVVVPDGGSVSDAVRIDDLRSVPIDVKLTLDIDHDRPEDLVVLLEDGNGQVATIWDRDAAPAAEMIVRAFPSDDMVNGTWTLTVIDEVDGVEGTLESWELYIVSSWD